MQHSDYLPIDFNIFDKQHLVMSDVFLLTKHFFLKSFTVIQAIIYNHYYKEKWKPDYKDWGVKSVN